MKALKPFTNRTIVTQDGLLAAMAATRETGFGLCDRGLENDIYGLAVPLFDETGMLAGTLAVASVASRITPAVLQRMQKQLIKAGREITSNWGGSVPERLQNAWEQHLGDAGTWETAS